MPGNKTTEQVGEHAKKRALRIVRNKYGNKGWEICSWSCLATYMGQPGIGEGNITRYMYDAGVCGDFNSTDGTMTFISIHNDKILSVKRE